MDPFVAEIRMFAGNFAPSGWAFCNGQILSISQNTALFALLGTTYGGNGQSNFALPDLQAQSPIGPGQGPGLSNYFLGEQSGVENVTLLTTEIPLHTHGAPQATSAGGTSTSPLGNTWAASGGGRTPPPLYATGTPNTPMNPAAIGVAGGGQPHQNRQPYLAVSFIIALRGVFPPRA